MESTQAGVTGRKPAVSGDIASKPDTVDPDELISSEEAARLLRQKVQTLAAWRSDKRGPEYVKIGRTVLYRRSSISTYIATQIVIPG